MMTSAASQSTTRRSIAGFSITRRKWRNACAGSGRRPQSRGWRIDETYVKVRGKWAYLYRAVDKLGNTIDLGLTKNT